MASMVIRVIREYSWAVWMVLVLGWFHVSINTVEFWVFYLSMAVLVEWSKTNKRRM